MEKKHWRIFFHIIWNKFRHEGVKNICLSGYILCFMVSNILISDHINIYWNLFCIHFSVFTHIVLTSFSSQCCSTSFSNTWPVNYHTCFLFCDHLYHQPVSSDSDWLLHNVCEHWFCGSGTRQFILQVWNNETLFCFAIFCAFLQFFPLLQSSLIAHIHVVWHHKES